jgi:NTE family protein
LQRLRNILMVGLFMTVAGCAHYPVNAGLATYDRDAGYRFKNLQSPDNSDSLFVILAFSGGGTRAAALSYGVLEGLRDTRITWEGRERRLLDEVDVISSISGGSFTAAYYGLHGDGIFTDFDSRFLKRDIQGALAGQLFSPVNWLRLASPWFDRIDMAAEYYDTTIFDRATYRDLLTKGRRPYLIINATDMTLGARFEFSQDQFDLLCADLAPFSVARAVAASSAFPVLLSPITVRNYAGSCAFDEPVWVGNALQDRDVAGRRYARATQSRSYQDAAGRPFIHLLDGGIADNIGLRGPHQATVSTDGGWSLLRMINLHKVRKVVVITVNAGTEPDTAYDRQERSPGVKAVLATVVNAPMDNYSFETIELLQQSFKQWQKDIQARKDCQEILSAACPPAQLPGGPLAEVSFYPVVVAFDALADPEEQTYFKKLPTTFALPAVTVDRLKEVGARLLGESKEFRRLLEDVR